MGIQYPLQSCKAYRPQEETKKGLAAFVGGGDNAFIFVNLSGSREEPAWQTNRSIRSSNWWALALSLGRKLPRLPWPWQPNPWRIYASPKWPKWTCRSKSAKGWLIAPGSRSLSSITRKAKPGGSSGMGSQG